LTEKIETLLLSANTTALMFFNPFVHVEVACCSAYSDHYICVRAILTGKKLPETEAKVATEIILVIIITCKAQPVMVKYRLQNLAQPLLNISAKSFNFIIWSLIKSCRVQI
jgi:hypothetical protein